MLFFAFFFLLCNEFRRIKDTGPIFIIILVDFLFPFFFWPFGLLLCVMHCIGEHMASLGGIEGWVPFNSL